MLGLQDIVGIPHSVNEAERVLDEAAQLSGRATARGRFADYVTLLKEAASFTYPCPFPWENDARKRSLFFEAASQLQQIADAAKVWGALDAKTAREKIKIILSGQSLAPSDPAVADPSRNILFEFAVARALEVKGFTVTLTAADEDVRAEFPGLPPFFVECKRPTNVASIAKNVKKSRRQIVERCDGRTRLGLPMFGVERLLGLGAGTPNVATFAELSAVIDNTLRKQIQHVREAQRTERRPFFPHAPIGGVLLTTAVFLADAGGIFSVSQTGLFCTGPEQHPMSMEIKLALSQTIAMV